MPHSWFYAPVLYRSRTDYARDSPCQLLVVYVHAPKCVSTHSQHMVSVDEDRDSHAGTTAFTQGKRDVGNTMGIDLTHALVPFSRTVARILSTAITTALGIKMSTLNTDALRVRSPCTVARAPRVINAHGDAYFGLSPTNTFLAERGCARQFPQVDVILSSNEMLR